MSDPFKFFSALITFGLWLAGIILAIQALQEVDLIKAVVGLALITAASSARV